jgi:hypothetical protein
LQLKKAKKAKKESPKESALEKLAVDPEVSPPLQAAAKLEYISIIVDAWTYEKQAVQPPGSFKVSL